MELSDRFWMAVDKVVRTFCLEQGLVVKDLTRALGRNWSVSRQVDP